MKSLFQNPKSDLIWIFTALALPGLITILPLAFYLLVIQPDGGEEVAPVVTESTLHPDAAAVATIAAAPERTRVPQMGLVYGESAIAIGERDFLSICSACHGTDGRGMPSLGKDLVDSDFMRDRDDQELLAFVIEGRMSFDPLNTTGVTMPQRGGNPGLRDQDILNIIAYIRTLDPEQDVMVVADADAPAADSDTEAGGEGDEAVDSEPVEFTPIDVSVFGGGDEDTDAAETGEVEAGTEVYARLCEADETSQQMCDWLVEGLASGERDAANIRDLLINGTSPFDSSVPEGITVPQRGGSLFLSDADIDALVAYLETLVGGGEEPETTPADEAGAADNDVGTEVYAQLCEADETSQQMCDWLVEGLASGERDAVNIRDLLINGTSPFDSSVPEGITVPQRGGSLFLSDADIDALVAYLETLAGGGEETETAPADEAGAADNEAGADVYAQLCEADESSQQMCDWLVEGLASGERDSANIRDLLINGTSPFDSSVPEGITVPQRGGTLFLSDADIDALVAYLQTLATDTPTPEATDGEESSDSDETAASTRGGEEIYRALCDVDTSSQQMCEWLTQLVGEEEADDEQLFTLLLNGTSPMDSSVPDGVRVPARGGDLDLTDMEIRIFIAYLREQVNAGDETSGTATQDYFARMSYTGQLKGSVISPPRELPDFTVPSTLGEDFTFSDYRGQIILIYFGYLTCPDVCPLTLADLMRAYQTVGEPADEVKVVFITVDPERDSLENIAQYVAAFSGDFIGLRPDSEEQLAEMMAAFGVIAEQRPVDSVLGYMVDHSAAVYLIGPDGRVMAQFPFGVPYMEIANDVDVMMEYMVDPESVIVQTEAAEAEIEVDPSREYRIVIPLGTMNQIRMGQDPGIIPLQIDLTIGVRDILVLENHDDADFLVGGVWVAPFETVRKQFYVPQTYVGLCTVTVGRDLIEIVVVEPDAE